MNEFSIPRIPLGTWIETAIEFLLYYCSGATRAFSGVLGQGLSLIEASLLFVPPYLMIVLIALITWRLTRTVSMGLFALCGFALIWNLGLWDASMSTLALVFVSTALAVLIGVPIGILAAMSKVVRRPLMPLLDVMQTMPSFVYLIPAIPFFGLGKVSALIATIVFSAPPAIRFTYLGIRQVPADLVECSDAFGTSRWQRLFKLELPMAAPTIFAGINQTVMLSLSMVVVAAMIGARGLGGEVWKAIQRLDMGGGFEAGLGIVILAICLDRILQSINKKTFQKVGK